MSHAVQSFGRWLPTMALLAACATPLPPDPVSPAQGSEPELVGQTAAEADFTSAANDLAPPPATGNLKDRRAPACGQSVTQGGRALAYRGVGVYSNGACQGTGISCAKDYSAGALAGFRANGASEACLDEREHLGPQPDYVGSFDPSRRSFNRWQCAEFVKRVFAILFGVKGWEGDAQDMLRPGNLPRGVVARAQGDAANPPVPGDAVVYGGGQYGHVALIVAVDLPRLTIIGQNEALQARGAEWRGGILTDRGTTMQVLGWAHAVNNPAGRGAVAPEPAQPAGAQPGPAQPAPEPADPGAAAECDERDHRYFECNDDLLSRFRCVGGRWETEPCPGGCDRRWWDDQCLAAQSPPPEPAPRAESVERDGRCDRSWQYYNCIEGGRARILCEDGYLVDYELCPSGCESMARGEHDVCAGDRGAVDEEPPPPRAIPVCADTCETAWDGECDDGGPGALYAVCDLGTDCGDCGERD
jgi:hypothetical protein